MKEIAVVPRRDSLLKKSVKIGAVACAAALSAVSSSFADIADLFTAVDTTGVDTSTTTIMVFCVTVGLMFFGRSILRRMGFSV